MSALGRTLLRLGAGLLVAYLGVLALLAWRQEWLIFRPHTLPAEHRFDLPTDVQERWFDTPGGGRIHALHLQRPGARGLVLHLHGNGGSVAGWFFDAERYRRANLDLLMIDYRGYGKSPGRITGEDQLMADVRAVWDAAAPAYAGRVRILLGTSLGTAPATVLAAAVQPEALILVSPFASLERLADELYPWVPGRLLRYPMRTDRLLPTVQGQVTLLHGAEDRMIDAAHARDLARLRPGSTLVVVDGAGHNDLHRFEAYRQALDAALRQALQAGPRAR